MCVIFVEPPEGHKKNNINGKQQKTASHTYYINIRRAKFAIDQIFDELHRNAMSQLICLMFEGYTMELLFSDTFILNKQNQKSQRR